MLTDVIDEVKRLPEALRQVRSRRPEFVDGAQACREAVLAPEVDVGLGHPLRAALAARMARMNAEEVLADYYRERLHRLGSSDALRLVADGAYPPGADRRLRAIMRHVDFITMAPRACTRSDTTRLVDAGLRVPEVIALAELVGFLNFEVRIAATLGLLRDTQP